ncbi:group I truncated hemoglobin [Agaribacterium haliotis]|uniref:group I truncated hemoglobin n=1 Tax=Agaribacterium haliotis TaxID=2013869 RepID=UPI000BB57931|nr:group 1 truncated hemoglobin [Agaribacterium haliotis]
MTASLYERLGGSEGITRIASDVVDLHLDNPAVSPRYSASNIEKLKHGAATFFITATGGPAVYEGKDMLATHKGMNINATEYMAVLDDCLAGLERNNIGQREQEEVLFALYGLRKEILAV